MKIQKKILLFTECLGSGGAQKQLYLLAKGLVNKGHDVRLIYYFKNEFYLDLFRDAGVKVSFLPRRSFIDIVFFKQFKKNIQGNNYDVIISFLDTPNFYLEVMKRLGFLDMPLITSQRRSFGQRIGLSDYFKTICHLCSTYFVVNSKSHFNRVKEKFPFLSKKLVYIPNGFETDQFIVKQNPRILYNMQYIVVARVQPIKNVLGIIKAFAQYNVERRHILHWYGKYNTTDPYYMQVHDYIIENNLNESILFLGESSELSGKLSGYSCLVLGSFAEGFPNVICEAFSAGLPVIASNRGEMNSLVLESNAGYTFDPENIASIVSAFRDFENSSEEKYIELSRNAKEYSEIFKVEFMIDKYNDLIQR